jgi:acetyl-CoA carboxylase biotin carboxyl carrier protein
MRRATCWPSDGMNLDDIRQILDLVREHDLAELEIERDGLKVRVRKAGREISVVPPAALPPAPAPAVASAAPALAPAAAPAEEPAGLELAVIKSPIVGTFYRAAEPSSRPFVEIGDTVRKGQVLCIIEAMKLMNEIESDCDGEISAVYVENGRPVQFGDRLFAVKVA